MLHLHDTVKGRIILENGTYTPSQRLKKRQKNTRSQELLYNQAQKAHAEENQLKLTRFEPHTPSKQT